MAQEMLINVSEGEECRIALLDNGRLEELYMERTSATSHVGNIYKGRVMNVEPSIQAAFVDFGLGRNGFLHISDLMPTYFGRRGEDVQETVGRKMARRDRPPIQRCLRRGDEIVVQIIKEGIGTKGPTLSTYVSIPGRILVMMPGMGKMGVSRKIEDEPERRRLRQILDSLKPPKDVGFIIRTAGVGKSKLEIQRDLNYLTRLWQNFEKKRDSGPAPLELFTEGDLVTRTVRDVFSADVERIVVDNKEVAKRIKEVIKLANPRTKNRVELYEEPTPLFHKYGIEKDIELMYSRHVPLRSGGSLVIDSTEAIVAIDVNSGKFRDHSDAETTAFKTDMEAADEIPRQLRLRDLGGVIICDFIDLRYERHRRELEKRLHDNFRNDRAKTKVLRMSQFGIIEMTRQRMRPSLKRSIYFDCPHCKGAGLVKTPESMSLDVMRRLAIALHDKRVARIELAVCPDVSLYLQNRKRYQLSALENETDKRVLIRPDAALGLDEMRLELFDAREGLVLIDELGPALETMPHKTQLGRKPRFAPPRGRFDNRGDRARPSRPSRRGEEPQLEERLDRDRDEDEMDDVENRSHSEVEEEPFEGSEVTSDLPPDIDTETASEAVPQDDQPAEIEPLRGADEDAGPPRRRRRRGRRGRGGRGGGRGPQVAAAGADEQTPRDLPSPNSTDESDAPALEVSEDDDRGNVAPQSEEGPPRRRRRRGGRGRRRGGASGDNGQPRGNAPPSATAPPQPRNVPAGPLPRIEPAPRTGSTDRHLVEDEPVHHEPVRRPRTYVDLDQIPEDLD